jgi:hypothetical protein
MLLYIFIYNRVVNLLVFLPLVDECVGDMDLQDGWFDFAYLICFGLAKLL